MIDVVYILSAGHSGSTLLNILLGSHPTTVAVSELSHLPKNIAHKERCSCGQTVLDCPVWKPVVTALSVRLGCDLSVTPYALNLGYIGEDRPMYRPEIGPRYRTEWKLRRMLVYLNETASIPLPTRVRRLTQTVLNNQLRAYDCIRAATGRQIVIDASKEYLQGIATYRAAPASTRLILMVRDGRAVFYSNIRRGHSMEESLKAWRNYYRHALPVVHRRAAPEHLLTVHYEDLAANPEQELRRICAFLQLPYCSTMLNPDMSRIHIISGNNMRLRGPVSIRLDESWRTGLPPPQLSYFEQHAGRLNGQLGY